MTQSPNRPTQHGWRVTFPEHCIGSTDSLRQMLAPPNTSLVEHSTERQLQVINNPVHEQGKGKLLNLLFSNWLVQWEHATLIPTATNVTTTEVLLLVPSLGRLHLELYLVSHALEQGNGLCREAREQKELCWWIWRIKSVLDSMSTIIIIYI